MKKKKMNRRQRRVFPSIANARICLVDEEEREGRNICKWMFNKIRERLGRRRRRKRREKKGRINYRCKRLNSKSNGEKEYEKIKKKRIKRIRRIRLQESEKKK